MRETRRRNNSGFILLFTLAVLLGLSGLALAFLSMLAQEIKGVGAGLLNIRAFYIAEAGRARARWALTSDAQAVGWGESNISFGGGTYTVTTAYTDPPTNSLVTITSDGYIPDSANPRARRRVVENNTLFTGGSGVNLSLAASASASGWQGQNTPDKAIDGQSNTKWISDINNGSQLTLEYTSAKTVSKVVVDGNKIDSYVVQYYNASNEWTAVTNAVGSIPGTLTFDPVTTSYLRLNVHGNKPQVNEFESYSGSGLGQGVFVTSY